MKYIIRKIENKDNPYIRDIIRTVLEEFGGKKEGTAYYDYDTEHMFEAYQSDRSIYFVAETQGKVLGGCGIKAVKGETENVCELQKLYLLKNYRGIGIGKELTQKCIEKAQEFQFQRCYLETLSNMDSAISLYSKLGFQKLSSAIGDTGHDACDVKMEKLL